MSSSDKPTDPIHADTPIEEIVDRYPKLVRPLMELGIACVVCGEPVWGTLAEQARYKGITDLDPILDHLNKLNRGDMPPCR